MRWSAVLLLTLFACGDDLSSPELTVAFDKTPSEISNLTHPEFLFHANGAVSRTTCTVDSAPAIPCRSPFTTDVTDGAHTLTVAVVGAAQQVGQATYQWSVDASPPETQLTLSPPALDGESASTIMFTASSGDVARFECALDDAPFASCTSPLALSVEDGLHTFRVRSVDRAGNPDPTPAATSWSVDTSAPLVTFTDGPIGPVASARPTFAFAAPPNARGLECKLDGAAFSPCTSPLTTAELAQGVHTFAVRATAATGNTGTVVRAFLVDTIGPTITIVTGPTGATDNTPTWTFTLAETPATATCRVDAAAWTACDAGTFTAQPLGDGAHTLEIEARDALGNLSAHSLPFSLDTSTCGDGVIDPSLDEVCDGTNLGGATCASAGDFDGGTLACNSTCGLDTSGCRKCGNGVIETPETCDGSNFGGATCGTYGFTAGTLACGATCGVDTSACGICGDGTAQLPEETCDGDDLRGATCASLGQGTGTLRCNTGCGGYDTSDCSGGDGYAPANTGFTGVPCFDGLRYSTPNYSAPYVLACTEEHGLFKTQLGAPLSWYGVNGGGITNLKGRAIATNPSGPPVFFVTAPIAEPAPLHNAFRSSNQGETWTGQSIHNAGAPRDLFAFLFRPQVGNLAGSWDPELGATVLHGAPPGLVPHFVGTAPGSVTGTVRSIASGGPKDVLVAVHGQTPSGAPATGGIFRACDLTATGGGSYTARHDGIADDDLARVWSITVDPSSIVPTPFLCGSTSVSGYATTYYAALRGGGQIYKTIDGGVSWSPRNTGLPAGAEVTTVALHCFSGTAAPTCNDPNRLYAATSVGLYTSADAGAHWELDGFAGKSVRAVAVDPVATPPHLLVGVDDAVGIYQSI